MDVAKGGCGAGHIKPSKYCGGGKKRKRRRSKSRKSKKGGCCCSGVKKRKRSSKKKKKCMKPGPSTVNPFLNFLRDFRKKHCGWSLTKIAIEGGKCWCAMKRSERQKYYKEACKMQKKHKGRSKSRSRSRSRSKSKC